MQRLSYLRHRTNTILRRTPPQIITPAEVAAIRPNREAPRIIRATTEVLVQPAGTRLIHAPSRPYWKDRDWIRSRANGSIHYSGFYRAADDRSGKRHTYPGRVIERNGNATAFIGTPPDSLLDYHPKRFCFHEITEKNWYRLHWLPGHRAKTHEEAISYMEHILRESINNY
jgi:hypothetical protein